VDTYIGVLIEVRNHLQQYQVQGGWSERLEEWIGEFRHLEPSARRAHLERTKRALAGMGSIGDIFICPQNGSAISADDNDIRTANDKLKALLDRLYSEIARELGQAYLT
jgi:hypothetical protein